MGRKRIHLGTAVVTEEILPEVIYTWKGVDLASFNKLNFSLLTQNETLKKTYSMNVLCSKEGKYLSVNADEVLVSVTKEDYPTINRIILN